MSSAFKRSGPDGPQKAFLYLILLGWVLMGWLGFNLERMSVRYGLQLSTMLLMFNLLLVAICYRRARRTGDGYMIYPVVGSALGSFLMVMWFLLF